MGFPYTLRKEPQSHPLSMSLAFCANNAAVGKSGLGAVHVYCQNISKPIKLPHQPQKNPTLLQTTQYLNRPPWETHPF